ncbi:hypothetical protein E2C01_045217 [Portunus trituberculatus]|uniref:Uncharacterized protein n=1 Tax=Portunus trituberculatus TaxID=210409 RepID=A0A5B7G286_PORTR|nr:hypothetical protein [Portunus trituberculatus]
MDTNNGKDEYERQQNYCDTEDWSLLGNVHDKQHTPRKDENTCEKLPPETTTYTSDKTRDEGKLELWVIVTVAVSIVAVVSAVSKSKEKKKKKKKKKKEEGRRKKKKKKKSN